MQRKHTLWYTLGEAEKASGVPRTRLDHACRVSRLPYRRSETGARLLSHDVIEKLRKDGLKAFPRPHDPIASSNDQEVSSVGTSGTALTAQRDSVEQKRVEIEEVRVSRELRKLKEQEQQEKAERHAAAAAERQATADRRAQAKYQRQQLRLEEARQAEAREQAAREAEARRRRREWEAYWLDRALNLLLPRDVPRNFELDVHQAVAALLPKLDSRQPVQLTERLIQAAIEQVLQPWFRKKEIEKIIEQARNQLPAQARSWGSTPNEWEARTARAAADAIAQLANDAPLAQIRAAVVESSKKVCLEYEAWKKAEDHRRAAEAHRLLCEGIVRWVFHGEDAREAVRQALEKLPVGAALAEMEKARDAALAPFRAGKKTAADADRYLLHVSSYIEEVGDEETGEWDLGDWFERRRLAEKLKTKLRPLLIQKLLEQSMDTNDANDFIEDRIDQELELED